MNRKLWILLLILAVGITLVHIYLGNGPSETISPLAIIDRLFDILISLSIVVASLGIGRIILRKLRWRTDFLLEESGFAFGIGLGALGILLLLLGFLHLLYNLLILGLLGAVILVTHGEWRAFFQLFRMEWVHHKPFSWLERCLLFAASVLVFPVLLGALTPPIDFDALTYHLVAPQLFLRSHAVVPSFDNIGVNYPIATDLLYLFGMAAGTDIAATLVHFSFALATCVLIYVFAVRYLTRVTGLLAIVIFWTSSAIGLSASSPIVDLGFAFYEFLALYAFFLWRESHRNADLVLAGIATGLALSNKYLAAVGALIVGVLILIESARAFQRRQIALPTNALIFGLAALLVALPWYLKNFIWLGNPVYPFFLGSYGLNGVLLKPLGGTGSLDDWVGMGMGHEWQALLAFPWNVYANWQAFGANRSGPSLFFLFLPFYLRFPKRSILNWVLLICSVRFLVWWQYAQNMRYLLMIFPWISIVSAHVVETLGSRMPRPGLRFSLALVVGLMYLVGIILQWGFLTVLRQDALAFLVGTVSRDSFLEKNLLGYPATRFINEKLPDGTRILELGEKRTYYIKFQAINDDANLNWVTLVSMCETPDGVARQLRALHITHIWIGLDDALYWRTFWNIEGPFRDQRQQFVAFRDRHLRLVYSDEGGHSVYELVQ